MRDHQPRLAFLGLGTMGTAIARTAHRSGVPVVVWNRDPAVSQRFSGTGIESATSVPAAVRSADVVITMVTNSDAVRSIANEQGLVEALRPGSLWANEHNRHCRN